MAVFEVGDNELPRKKGYLDWGEITHILIPIVGVRTSIESKISHLSSLSQSKNSSSLVFP